MEKPTEGAAPTAPSTKDYSWYTRHVGDLATGEIIPFQGGELAYVDWELDALFHGVAAVNRRRALAHWMRCALAVPQWLGGLDVEVPGYLELNTTAWIPLFGALDDPYAIGAGDPGTAVNFRLDVLRALASIPRSRRRAFFHRMDGLSYEDIARIMGWKTTDAEGREQPAEEAAEYAVRAASGAVRKLTSLDIPGKKRTPKAAEHPTSVVNRVERELASARRYRAKRRR